MQNLYLTRHTDLIKDIDLNAKITILGVGSVGSYTALALAKLGFRNLTVVDNGFVDAENISPQYYSMNQIGMKKVDALRFNILRDTGINIRTFHCDLEPLLTLDEEHFASPDYEYIPRESYSEARSTDDPQYNRVHENEGVKFYNSNGGYIHDGGNDTYVFVKEMLLVDHLILAVDSMALRKKIIHAAVSINENNDLLESLSLIDARMAVKFLSIYCYSNNRYKEYLETSVTPTLFSDEEAVQEACTNKATSFTSFMAGSLIAKITLDMLNQRGNPMNKSTDGGKFNYVTHFDISSQDIFVTTI